MKRKNQIRRVLFLFILFSVCLNAQNEPIALSGVNLWHNGSFTPNRTVLIEKGIIKEIYETGAKKLIDSVKEIDLKGHYIIPGLIDTHVHMGMGNRALPRSPDTARLEFKRWIYSGVTSVRDMGGDARLLAYENRLIFRNENPGPEVYFSSTFGGNDMMDKDIRMKIITQGVEMENAGWTQRATPEMDVKLSVTLAKGSLVSGIKFYAGIDADLIKEITEEAHKQGLKSWGHLTVFPNRPIEVIEAGVDVVSHVWGAFWQDEDVDPTKRIPFTHTNFNNARTAIYPADLSNLNADSPELKMLLDEMVKRNVIWDINYSVYNTKMHDLYRAYAMAASNAGVMLSTGTDYYNDITDPYPTVFKEIEDLVIDGILTTAQVLEAATLNGAKAIGIENTHGTIEKGKIANLVVLRKNPIEDIKSIRAIEFTMKNGNIFYRKDYK
ncbi:amidohydrolase family protein [Gramella sp. GC03-9]|uniref:Amidohydrolase family protein n=1 Tax=Christiangramia oceanisediminis TaxID=2920386 RepID=A0A9X2IA30_9FLAO|nr:amidohydrolase family protein [Gramella oceanisediminis]MCP9199987.1 amidohydrolase family protein [Gramella oceanisediminis]